MDEPPAGAPRPLPPAAWHPDPWDPARALRWWDGTAWTGHVHPLVLGVAPLPDLVEREVGMAPWAKAGMAAMAVCLFLVSLSLPSLFHWFGDQIRTIRDTPAGETPELHPAAHVYLIDLLALPQLLGQALLLAWQYRSNVAARRAGLSLTHSPGVGVGAWFLPIVNFWIPYQALRDSFPAGDPGVRRVLPWWLGWIGASVATYVAALLWMVSPTAGVVAWSAYAVFLLWWVRAGWRLVTATTAAHRQLAGLP